MTEISMHPFRGSGADWNAMIAGLPGAHLLQTWEWAQVKAAFGWQPMPLVWRRGRVTGPGPQEGPMGEDLPVAAAMVLKRSILSRGFVRHLCVLYVPKGPLLDWGNSSVRDKVLEDLESFSRQLRAVLLKIDPDIEYSKGYPGFDGTITGSENGMPRVLLGRGWRFSDDQVQFRNTAVLDLSNAEDALLRNMKQKTRYNIRLAERKGVTVRPGQLSDIPALYQMYAETSVRDGFVIRAAEYYRRVWSTFLRPLTDHNQPGAEALIAEVEGQTVAGILVYYFAKRAYYLYGMSRAAHRDKMPNHLLQWEAIRGAKSQGSLLYDLWGAPDAPDESDPMWGVYRFKEGLGAEVVCTIGAWDFPTSVLWYAVYTRLVPRVLGLMRARGRRQVKEALGGP